MSAWDAMRRAYIMLSRDGTPATDASDENRGMLFIARGFTPGDELYFSQKKDDDTYQYARLLNSDDLTAIDFSLAAKQVAGESLSFSDGTPTLTLGANAGSTASTSGGAGCDSAYAVAITPSGTGIASGKILSVAFSAGRADATSYVVAVSARNAAAGAVQFYTTNRTASGFDLNVVSALTSGTAYNLGWLVAGF